MTILSPSKNVLSRKQLKSLNKLVKILNNRSAYIRYIKILIYFETKKNNDLMRLSFQTALPQPAQFNKAQENRTKVNK
jgi:hypothetical protein